MDKCNEAREPTQEALDIPDRVVVSLTHKGIDYPLQRPDQIFSPKALEMITAGSTGEAEPSPESPYQPAIGEITTMVRETR